jgi:hypothetical protein
MVFKVPPGYVVYDMDAPGMTVRLAIDPQHAIVDAEKEFGWRKAEDQKAPVYDVLHPKVNPDQSKEKLSAAELDKMAKEKDAKKSLRKSAREFAAAHKRLITEGRVPDHVAHYRLTVCTGTTKDGKFVSAKCPRYKKEDKGWGTGHCKGCGCPDWPISQMHRNGLLSDAEPGKAWFPIGCPLGKFSEHPGRRAKASITESANGL